MSSALRTALRARLSSPSPNIHLDPWEEKFKSSFAAVLWALIPAPEKGTQPHKHRTCEPHTVLWKVASVWELFSLAADHCCLTTFCCISNKIEENRQWLRSPTNKLALLINHKSKEVLGVLCTTRKVEIPSEMIHPRNVLNKKKCWEMRSIPRSPSGIPVKERLQQIKTKTKKIL